MIGQMLENEIERKLAGYVPVAKFNDLAARLSRLEEENSRLREGVIDFKKEVFTLKELADVLLLDPTTVRKNYIYTGRIRATKLGKQWEVRRDEYMRVLDVVSTRGKSYL